MTSKKTQYLSIMAMFLAIEILLVITPLGYIPVGPMNATTMHIPVLIAGIVLGRKAGAQIGFVFGITSVLNATFRPGPTSFVFSPFIRIGAISGNWKSLIIAIVPRILVGLLAGFVFEQLHKRKVNEHVSVVVGAFVGAITNTVLVLAGIYFFFGQAYAETIQVAYQTLMRVLFGIVTSNGIAEAILGAVITLLVYKAIRPYAIKYKQRRET